MAKRRTQADKSDASARRVLKAALSLFSRQGYRATSMRQIASRSKLSVGNLYHHFGNKEAIFQRLIDHYWEVLLDPELPLNKIFAAARFPDDLEAMAAAIDQVVSENSPYILLIYIDVIEFKGRHIRTFYQQMADRFRAAYAARFAEMQEKGEIGEVDPLVGVMLATRWFFYYFTVERCFGVPMHFGLDSQQAVGEFSQILRYGLMPRREPSSAAPVTARGGKR
ncbi:MAG TPA: TetR/AcrR family transcriptional regulator [Solirubrobacterales bacterium]|nr:TetR/AcrR family transcriptional regulator [Solirubrobacterales bacterium]